MPKKETKILMMVMLFIDLLSIGAFIFLYYLTTNLINETINLSDSVKAELKMEDTAVLLKDDLALGKNFQDELMNYIIPKGGTVDFIKTIEQLVTSSGIKSDISSVINEPYDKGTAIGAELVRVNMTVIGEWKNIQFFLKLIENYPLKIDIKQASFSKVSDYTINGAKIPQWSGNFNFTAVKIKD